MLTVLGELGGTRWPPLLLGGTVILVAALVMKWAPRLPAPLIGVALAGILARLLVLHETEVGSLHLTMPPPAGFNWAAQDVASVLPQGLMLAFVSAANLLLTSRAVEHFQGKHKHLKRSDADAELGAYGIANLSVGIFGAPMSIGIPARSVANVRCGGTTRISNLMHGLFLFLLVKMGSGALAHIPMVALAGVTAWMGICLLDVSTWRRLSKMRLTDASAFLVTAIGVLIVNAVAAVMAGCAIYLVHYLYVRYIRSGPGATVQSVPSIAK
jgi:SulP family sulfate permease